MLQTVAVILIVLTAVGYAVWLAVRSFRQASDPCAGCSGCALKATKDRAARRQCAASSR